MLWCEKFTQIRSRIIQWTTVRVVKWAWNLRLSPVERPNILRCYRIWPVIKIFLRFWKRLAPSKFHLEDGGSNFLRNARKFLPLYTASHPFRRNTDTVIVEMRLKYLTNWWNVFVENRLIINLVTGRVNASVIIGECVEVTRWMVKELFEWT